MYSLIFRVLFAVVSHYFHSTTLADGMDEKVNGGAAKAAHDVEPKCEPSCPQTLNFRKWMLVGKAAKMSVRR